MTLDTITCDTMPDSPPATVVPFPARRRREREAPRAGEPRGQILLFLGVRYERLPEAEPAPRRRRRS